MIELIFYDKSVYTAFCFDTDVFIIDHIVRNTLTFLLINLPMIYLRRNFCIVFAFLLCRINHVSKFLSLKIKDEWRPTKVLR